METRDFSQAPNLPLKTLPGQTSIWDRLVPDLKLLLLKHLDLVTSIKASAVSKEWERLLHDDFLWKEIHEHSNVQAILYQGQLWKILYTQAENPSSNSVTLLASYFKEIFEEKPENPIHFLDNCFSHFLDKNKEIKYSNTDLTRLKQYISPFPDKNPPSFYVSIQLEQLLTEVEERIKNEKVSQLDKLTNITPINYCSTVKLFLQLRQLEQLLTTLLIFWKVGRHYFYPTYLSAITNSLWTHSLTAKGLLLLTTHYQKLNSKYEYDKTNKLLKTDATQVTKVQKTYFECLQNWFSQADEEELKAFAELASSSEFILTEPALAHISARTMLILALCTPAEDIPLLFGNLEFIQRLKTLPHAGNILIGLAQNKVAFNEEILQGPKNDETRRGKAFAQEIIYSSRLSCCLTDEELLTILNLSSDWSIALAIGKNDDFANRIACDINLLIVVAKTAFTPLLLAKHTSIMNKLTGDTCTSLALTNDEPAIAIAVLKNDQFALLLRPHHFEQLKKKYGTVQSLIALILKREGEWQEREKAVLATKTELELYHLALSEHGLLRLATHCLAGRSHLASKLTSTQFIALFNHCNRPLQERQLLFFAEPVAEILAQQSLAALFSLALGQDAIAYFAAEYLSKNEKHLTMLATKDLQSLIQHYHALLPAAASFTSAFKNALKRAREKAFERACKAGAIEQSIEALPLPNRSRSYSFQDLRPKENSLRQSPPRPEKQHDSLSKQSRDDNISIRLNDARAYERIHEKAIEATIKRARKKASDSGLGRHHFKLKNYHKTPMFPEFRSAYSLRRNSSAFFTPSSNFSSRRSKGSLACILKTSMLVLLAALGLLCLATGAGALAGLGFLTAALIAINVFKLSMDIIATILMLTGAMTTASVITFSCNLAQTCPYR
jgi:hypothetical protein